MHGCIFKYICVISLQIHYICTRLYHRVYCIKTVNGRVITNRMLTLSVHSFIFLSLYLLSTGGDQSRKLQSLQPWQRHLYVEAGRVNQLEQRLQPLLPAERGPWEPGRWNNHCERMGHSTIRYIWFICLCMVYIPKNTCAIPVLYLK